MKTKETCISYTNAKRFKKEITIFWLAKKYLTSVSYLLKTDIN